MDHDDRIAEFLAVVSQMLSLNVFLDRVGLSRIVGLRRAFELNFEDSASRFAVLEDFYLKVDADVGVPAGFLEPPSRAIRIRGASGFVPPRL